MTRLGIRNMAFTACALFGAVTMVGGIACGGTDSGESRSEKSDAITTAWSAPARYGQSELQRDLDAIRDAGVVGVQAEVSTKGRRIVARSGVAEVGTKRQVPSGGYFRIGSATKTFTATVVLQLVAEKRLSLDDTVERWLPGVVKGNGHDGTKITVRQLLQHTSGIFNFTDDLQPLFDTEQGFYQNRFKRHDGAARVAMAMRHPPSFSPGQGQEYSNTNYALAGMIIEKVTGESWHTEVERRIIVPLHLWHTSVPRHFQGLPYPHAEGYTRDAQSGRLFDSTELDPSAFDAGGAIVSTPGDLNRFWHALLGGRLLEPEQLEAMLTTVPTGSDPKLEYGLGIFRVPLSCGGWYWRHGGDVMGFATYDGVTEDGRTSIVISASTETWLGAQLKAASDAVDHALCANANANANR